MVFVLAADDFLNRRKVGTEAVYEDRHNLSVNRVTKLIMRKDSYGGVVSSVEIHTGVIATCVEMNYLKPDRKGNAII